MDVWPLYLWTEVVHVYEMNFMPHNIFHDEKKTADFSSIQKRANIISIRIKMIIS
jgi:hypothetical protein